MGLSVEIANIDEQPFIYMLLQSYLRELAEFEDIPRNESGEYEYQYLKYYWTENTRWPYLFYFDGKTAGFALVQLENETFIMAEFTVFMEYRGYGFGLVFADELIQKHPGKWNIEYDINNAAANNFWNKLVKTIKVSNLKKEKVAGNREYLEFLAGEK